MSNFILSILGFIRENLVKLNLALTFEEEVEMYWEDHKGYVYLSIFLKDYSMISFFNRNFNKELQVRNELIKSICPQIYEKNDIKLGLLLCVIGGVSKTNRNTKIRGQSHMILVGEPGEPIKHRKHKNLVSC